MINKKNIQKSLRQFMIFALLVATVYTGTSNPALAALTISHSLTDSGAGNTATHTIEVETTITLQPEDGDTLLVSLPDDFTENGSFTTADFSATLGSVPPAGPPAALSIIDVNYGAPDCSGATGGGPSDEVAIGITNGVGTLDFTLEFCEITAVNGFFGIVTELTITGVSPNGELTNPSSGGVYSVDYTFTSVSNGVDSDSDDLTITGGGPPGIEGSPTGYTTMNRPHLDRLEAGQTDVAFELSFELAATSGASDTLSIVFPSGFSNVDITSASGTCSGGGTISNWQVDSLNAWADKANCAGTVTVTGITVDLPSSTGAYVIQWSNDNGSGAVYIVDSDQVTVTSNVDPTLSFDIDTSVNTAADTAAPYTVDFGTLNSTDTNVSGEGTVNYIMVDLSTNATHGAYVTVKNQNGSSGLVSTSTPTDSVANAAAAMASGTENYGFCVQYVNESTGASFAKSGDYATGTCADQADGNDVEALSSSTAANVFSVDGPVNAARGVISGSATASVLTEAHDDYTDILTFIATSTF